MRIPENDCHSGLWRCVNRRGFTLLEILVSIAIIGLLLALLVPAVQSARASARRATCQNQLRQLGLALHLYHDCHDCFPCGSYIKGPSLPIQSGWGWGAMVLPFVDSGALYEQIDFRLGTAVGSNFALIETPVSLWRCPSDIVPDSISADPIFHPPFILPSGNMCGSAGILYAMSRVRMGDIRDGTSNTLMLGERLVQTDLNGGLPSTSAWCGQVAFTDGYEYRSVPYVQANQLHPINASESDPACFGSRHTGGANFVLADGSVRFLSDDIDSQLFEALGTAKGREVVQLP